MLLQIIKQFVMKSSHFPSAPYAIIAAEDHFIP